MVGCGPLSGSNAHSRKRKGEALSVRRASLFLATSYSVSTVCETSKLATESRPGFAEIERIDQQNIPSFASIRVIRGLFNLQRIENHRTQL